MARMSPEHCSPMVIRYIHSPSTPLRGSLLLLLAGWCHRPTHVDATVCIFLLLLCRLQNLERTEQRLIDAHHRTCIVKLTTVVGRREQRHKLPLGKELVAILYDLVCTTNQVHIVLSKESRHHIWSERKRYTTVVLRPPRNILVRVRPQKITQQTSVRHIRRSHHAADLLHALKIRRQTTMHRENLFINDCSNRKTVEAVCECLPQLNVESALAFVVEAVDTVDTGTLVVAAKNEEVLRVLDFVRKQQAYRFQALLTAVHIVTKEKVVGLRWEAAILEQAEQVVVLTMDITWYVRNPIVYTYRKS